MLKDTHDVTFNKLYRQINTSDNKPGITQIDILAFAPPLDTIFNTFSHQHCLTAAEFAIEFDLTEAQAKQLVDMLVNKGYLVANETGDCIGTAYKINYARKKPRKATTNIWDTLDI